ncbi:MAG: FkbM family methyltransferase [Caulobacteraceae bacterium]|nr:FkbM family methyltransferase [Caulobacter sp.]
MTKIIYDFGANNGDDIPYYLLKADRVVAVEANPVLAEGIASRFAPEVESGRLHVVGCALTDGETSGAATFHVHRHYHFLSQFPAPEGDAAHDFKTIEVPTIGVVELVRAQGAPFYVKIDVEGYDQNILRALFEAGIYPPYISVESHSIEVFALLVASGRYGAFKLVEGNTVERRYGEAQVATANGGRTAYRFPRHSAGPFGEDIEGPWMTANAFFKVLSVTGLGWRDIHASRVDAPDADYLPATRFALTSDF